MSNQSGGQRVLGTEHASSRAVSWPSMLYDGMFQQSGIHCYAATTGLPRLDMQRHSGRGGMACNRRTASWDPAYTLQHPAPMAAGLADHAKSLLGDFSRVVVFDEAGQQLYTSCKVCGHL